eukprot:CAMPEP_0116123306 /NCGR_PEP_ID=MMETSP0329-20121206/4677_1 /TAXON_ID=697910 /ORGANISM="Pseudo-nitzschia arenysensis, Strain B593" /LENGTH=156 /DNA_ID=CAMNT_0003617211 /DNA_START=56 /DNA_END=526 /DNA_ORIENTATION=+
MFNSSRVISTLGRRALRKSLRTNVVSQQVGAIRLSSYFTPAHEYVKVEGNVGVCGITDFAQSALGDIVFVELPSVGDEFDAGDSFGSVESVKAASDVYAPVSGTIIEVNETLEDSPELVNSSAEDEAWFVKIEMNDTSEVNELMDETAYEEHCENE